ncbi:MAG: hypothetical protein JNM84_20330 [Planctomycetes bacterium]|nr:hypothetical protein [Planctomycetota bacterium]
MIEKLARTKAEELGLPHAGRNLSELVRSIQQREGYEACFDTGNSVCPHESCCWRESCLGRALTRRALELGVPIEEAAVREARTRRAAMRLDRRLRRLEQIGV